MPEDMDVLIGRIQGRIKFLRDIIKSKGESKSLKENAQIRIDAYETVLAEIKGIIEHG